MRTSADKQLLAHIGAAIRAARHARGLSQEELAELADLHRTYIGSVERGERNISVLNLCSIAHALQATPAQLLGDLARGGATQTSDGSKWAGRAHAGGKTQ